MQFLKHTARALGIYMSFSVYNIHHPRELPAVSLPKRVVGSFLVYPAVYPRLSGNLHFAANMEARGICCSFLKGIRFVGRPLFFLEEPLL